QNRFFSISCFQSRGLNDFNAFFKISAFLVFPRKSNHLLRNSTRSPPRFSAEIVPKSFGNGNRIESGMTVEIFIFKKQQTLLKSERHRIYFRKPPLSVVGNSGSKQMPVTTFHNRCRGNIK